jgi:hypothetical protein
MSAEAQPNERPAWCHKLNAASPEFAKRAEKNYAAKSHRFCLSETDCLSQAFLWGDTPEGDGFWLRVSCWIDGHHSKLPAIPTEAEP